MSAPRRIVVGVDGSDDSRCALEWAVDLAKALGCEVVAVHALGLLTRVDGSNVEPSDRHRADLRSLLEGDWTTSLASSDVAHRFLLLDGNPVTALMSAANEEEADLLVVGTRGTGGFPGLQLGSTSHQLVQHCDRPVVVVPTRDGRF